MKILVVSLFLPQEKAYHAGGRYVFELLRNLSRRHTVDLATRLEDGESLEEIRPFCRNVFPYHYRPTAERGWMDVGRLVANYLGFSRFADRFVRKGDYDIIQVEWVEAALLIRRGSIPMVLDAHDVITKPAERRMRQRSGLGKVFAWFVYRMVRAAEEHSACKFDVVLTRSEFDRQYLDSLVSRRIQTEIVPHPAGLDITDRFFQKEDKAILFLASYKYRSLNVNAALYFYRQVFPLVRLQVPNAKFIIAGYGPPDELRALAELDPQVRVPGYVEDLDACYKQAEVFVAPILTGGGIIVKILDALAAGAPVVTTTYGNEGVGAIPGRDLLIGDDPDTMAAAIVRLLLDREFAKKLATQGREFVRLNYGVEQVFEKLEGVFANLYAAPAETASRSGLRRL